MLAIAAAALVVASISGDSEQPPDPISVAMPAPYFATAQTGALSAEGLRKRERSLGPRAPAWADRMYRQSVEVLIALTDPRTGAMIAGERPGWDYVWPRDAAAGAIALAAAGLRPEARRVASFLEGLDVNSAARFYPDGGPVPGRPPAGDPEGWVAAAEGAAAPQGHWRDRQDYGEKVTGDLLGNAIAAGAPAGEILGRFGTPEGLVREQGSSELDSSAAWAVTLFPQPGLRRAVETTLMRFVDHSTPYGIPPIEGWTPGEVWTAPTAWSAYALAVLGGRKAADRLLCELRRAATPAGTLPERVSSADGHPTSTTPLAWSHAFAILALRARYGG